MVILWLFLTLTTGVIMAEGAGGWNKLMRQSNSWDHDNTWELIDLSNSSFPNCPLPDYPLPIKYPAAVVFDERSEVVRACGGYIGHGGEPTTRCFTFDGSKWEENMKPSREEHSNSNYNSNSNVPDIGWWIFQNDFSDSDSSEVFNKNGVWESGPSAPRYNGSSNTPSGFCSVQLNSTHTAVIGGGLSDTSIADVIFYDWAIGEWIPGPPLQTPRRYHVCTSLGNGQMMVAGGFSLSEVVSSVEIFDSSLDSWYFSEDLPEEADKNDHDLITWNGNPVWLNGENMWKYEKGSWYPLQASVTDGYHYDDFILMVPDDFIPDC